MATDGPERLSISRDALRADLAEMELRLRTWIGTQLEQKADAEDVVRIQAQVTELAAKVVYREGPLMNDIRTYEENMRSFSRGDFTEAQKRAFNQIIDANLKEHTDTGWTQRQRYIAVVALLVSMVAVISSIYLAVHFAK